MTTPAPQITAFSNTSCPDNDFRSTAYSNTQPARRLLQLYSVQQTAIPAVQQTTPAPQHKSTPAGQHTTAAPQHTATTAVQQTTPVPQHKAAYFSSTAYSHNSRPADDFSSTADSRLLQLHSIQQYWLSSRRLQQQPSSRRGKLHSIQQATSAPQHRVQYSRQLQLHSIQQSWLSSRRL